MPACTHDLKRDTRSQEQGFPDRNGVGGTKAAPRAKPLGPARPEAPARNWQIISAGWVWDAGGAFGKREQAEEKHSFQARAENYSSQPWRKTPWTWDLSPHEGGWVPGERNWAAQAAHQEPETSWCGDQGHTVLRGRATYYCPLLCRHSSGLTSICVLPANYNKSSSVKRNKKIWHKWTHLWNRNRLTDIQNRLMVASQGQGREDGEFGISRCKLLYIEQINNKVLLYSTRNCIQYPLINHNGREYEKAYLYMYIWITLLYSRNEHNVVTQPEPLVFTSPQSQ